MLFGMPLYPPNQASDTALDMPQIAGQGTVVSVTLSTLLDELDEMLRDLDGIAANGTEPFRSRAQELGGEIASFRMQVASVSDVRPSTLQYFDFERGRFHEALLALHEAQGTGGDVVYLGAVSATSNKKMLYAALGSFAAAGLAIAVYFWSTRRHNVGRASFDKWKPLKRRSLGRKTSLPFPVGRQF